jgi:transposase-like protein
MRGTRCLRQYRQWADLYRAGDSAGSTLAFVLSPYRAARSTEYFFRKLLGDTHLAAPRVITVYGNAAYPAAFTARQEAGERAPDCAMRPGTEEASSRNEHK